MEGKGFFFYKVYDIRASQGKKKIIVCAFTDDVLDLQAEIDGL
jgi:hypothetical protein